MKIVHLCLSCFFIDNYSYQENMLPKFHVKMGHDVTVIASLFTFNEKGRGTFFPGPFVKEDKDGFKVIRLAYKEPTKLYRKLRCYKYLYETLTSEKPDVIFTHGVAMGDTLTIVRYLKKHPKVILYGDHHGDFINSAKNWFSKNILHPIIWRHYVKVLEPYLRKCYGVTPMRCRFLKEVYHVNPSLIEFLPMGVDDEAIPENRDLARFKLRNELNIEQNDFLIMTGGKIDKLKNTHILLEALKQLNNSKIHLVICGTLTEKMKYLQDSFGENIHYLGWCNAERVMNCMVASDLACFPGTHSTLWEQAVGVGLPAVFKNWKEMTHMNTDDNCVFVKGEDVDELRCVLEKFLNPIYYDEMKTKAELASQNFLYSNIARIAIEGSL